MVSTPVIIPGYQVSEELYNGSRSIIYKAVREVDNLPVIIRLLKNPYPSFQELVKFRNQYTIAKNLNFPGIIQTYNLEPYQNSYIVVMEDFGGISLSEWMRRQEGVNLRDFLAIAISLCDILNIIYHQRIIHKNIKPSNILINPETKEIKLIDFCIASLLPRETQNLISPNILEGTLAYMSPEQTGRMNRVIDYRTDYYSLGVTLYELLTGKLPFPSNEPMELVHCHIAQMPSFVSDVKSEISPVIGEIINKLMAKNAEERYQSALGIKYDLEICLAQLQSTGKIKDFAIGTRDIGDRFIIPEKLYGREKEVEELLTAFNRVAGVISSNSRAELETESEKYRKLVLVAGCSGIGKTAVINEVHQPIVKQRGYFIKGKFDQFNRNIPFSAFVQAFRDLMGQLLSESNSQLLSWRTKILTALGESGQVLIEVIPELERIIGQQPPVPKISGTAAQNRFNLLFQKFLKVFTTKAHPLVIFIDDLQWADLASLNLIKLLMSAAESGYLLIIGAYRDNEVDDVPPLMLMLNQLRNLHSHIQTITLSPLSQWTVNKLVADTINCSEEVAYPLAQLVYQKAEGNPFFTTQFLKSLYQDGLITFNQESRCWQCDITQVNLLAITEDVVNFMAFQLKRLPPSSQQVLKMAACIGNSFDVATLAIVCEQSEIETATDLWRALEEGLILPQSEIYKFYLGENDAIEKSNQEILSYKFLHDRVQQAAYSLILETDRQRIHFQIGQLLLNNTSEQQLEEIIFAIANQFNMGIDELQQPTKRHEIAQLNLLAGKKAKKSTAYSPALNYLNIGIQLLLPLNPWQTDYNLILDLYSEATEASYLTGEFEVMEAFFREVVQNTQTIVDATKVYKVKIEADYTQGKLLTAIDTAMEFLQPLGIEFPSTPTVADFILAQESTAACLSGKTIAELASFPEMENRELCAVMSILAKASTPAFTAKPELHRLIILKKVALSAQFGNTPASALAYAYYGMMLCGKADSIPRGYEFGKLALELVSRFADREYEGMIMGTVHLFITHWQEAVSATFEPFLKAYSNSLENGYLAYAGYAIQAYCFHAYISAQELTALVKEFAIYGTALQKINQQIALNYHCINHQMVLNFIEPYPQPWELKGTVYDENLMLQLHEKTKDDTALWCVYVNKSILAYIFQNWDVAGECIRKAKQYISAGYGTFNVALLNFYDSLQKLAILPTEAASDRETILQQVVANQQMMQTWANYAPMNHQHRWELVEAEKYRVLGQTTSAIEYYDHAIATAKTNGYIQDQALANELTAKFYLAWGKEKIAAAYMQDAYYCYACWGAKAKTDNLEKNYPNLLHPILQPAKQSINALDDAAIIKASQILSSTIQLDELLHQLTQVILQNSGANRCVLVLPHEDGEWYVEAIATPQEIELCSQPLENHPRIPIQLIQYVKNTQKVVVIEDLNTDLPVIGEYLLQERPKSVLCLPLLNQGKLIGILYLKNTITSRVFTSDRIEVLQILTTQAAISLENARLYQQTANYSRTLELEVERQTQALQQKAEDLEQALTTLQHTNEELIRLTRLKDEFLANMSHELRTPLNAILGMTEGLQDEIFGNLTPGQIKALKTIETSSSHLLELINDILDVAKIESGQVELRLHNIVVQELCTSTLDFIKQQALHKNIQLQTKFAENIPNICVDERRIRQVLINLLNNAVKFTPVGGCITLEVSAVVITDKNYIRIAVTDTGIGIAPENIGKLFQPFIQIDSSLNRQYQGTGLGLALVKRIVQLHGGQVGLTSEMGVGSCFTIDLPL